MAGIGVLVDDNGQTEYAYKIKVPTGSANNGIVDLSNPSGVFQSFIDDFELAKRNADSISNTYANDTLVSQNIVENGQTIYNVAFSYTLGVLQSKTISKTSGGSITMTYNYNPDGSLASISQSEVS